MPKRIGGNLPTYESYLEQNRAPVFLFMESLKDSSFTFVTYKGEKYIMSMMWGNYNFNAFGWGGIVGGILTLLFWALIIWAVVTLIRALVVGPHSRYHHRDYRDYPPYTQQYPPSHSDTGGEARALNILKERYARGEINKEEFEAKRQDLGL